MLRVHTQRLGDVATLRFHGRIVNGVETVMLRKAVFAQEGASVVVLDLARVNGVDAGGLGSLLELREWTQSKGIEFRLVNVTKLVKQVLEITRLDAVFEISSEEDTQSNVTRRRARAVEEDVACA